jgi:hypothetical protein
LTNPTIIGVSPVINLAGDLTGSVTLTDLGEGTLTATIAQNSVELGTHTTGSYMSDVIAGTGIVVTHTPGEGSSATIALSASINDLSDVTISDLADGDFLRYSNIANAWINDPVNLSTDTVGDYVQSLNAGTGITLTNNSGEGATPTIAVTENTYDAYGAASSAASGAATALSNHESDTTNIHGIADTANLVTLADEQTLTNKTLTNPTITGVSPVINLAGDLTGSVTLTDLGNGTLTATIVQDSVALGTHTIGDYVQDLVAGVGITISNNSGEGATPTIEVTTHTYEEYGSVADHGSETTNIHGIANTADLVTLAGTQNLTNKTLTSPTIKNVSPTITLEGDLTGSVTLTDLNSGALTATIAEYSIDSSHISLAFQYVENISAGNNIVINNEYVGPGAVGNYTIETSDTPNFASVTTTSLIVDDIEIDPTGANSSDQVLRFDSENNKFIPGVASTVANNSVSSNKLNLLYANTSVFPSASTHHGSIAHSHADGAMFFAHGGNWIKMISEEDGYVASVTSGNNIVITNNVGIGGLDPIIAVDDNPSFGNVSASSLTISSIEIDPTGANSGQVLKFNGIKFVAGDDQGSELSVIERYSEVIGNNYDTVFQINHSLGTRNVLVEIYDNITYETIMTKIARTTINSITVSFATVIPTNSYTVVVIG